MLAYTYTNWDNLSDNVLQRCVMHSYLIESYIELLL